MALLIYTLLKKKKKNNKNSSGLPCSMLQLEQYQRNLEVEIPILLRRGYP